MPKLLVALSALLLLTTASAQDASVLDTTEKRYSYILGFQLGRTIAPRLQNETVTIDPEALTLAIKDVLAGIPPRLSQQDFVATITAMQELQAREKAAAAEKNREAGEAFLANNREKEGIVVLPSGLQYEILTAGSGDKPNGAATVTVHYRGTLISGAEFDSSYSRGAPATFAVSSVIPGFQEALQLMSEGAKWTIYVPADLAYGTGGAGKSIGPNETLIFQLELIEVLAESKAEEPKKN